MCRIEVELFLRAREELTSEQLVACVLMKSQGRYTAMTSLCFGSIVLYLLLRFNNEAL
jgi:hypothetical protein